MPNFKKKVEFFRKLLLKFLWDFRLKNYFWNLMYSKKRECGKIFVTRSFGNYEHYLKGSESIY